MSYSRSVCDQILFTQPNNTFGVPTYESAKQLGEITVAYQNTVLQWV